MRGLGGRVGFESDKSAEETKRQQHIPARRGLRAFLPRGSGVEFSDGFVRGNSEIALGVLLRQVFEIVLLLFQVLYVPSQLI